ncbi:low molecular weight protein-tyrosine-phosphatase [Halostreptopolyspora alba]|uniref:protein-tyrosine-phosphatase n=1 Tax=Halostreptopolyspora alba TaxID=2487137 RepID=A0A3N0ECH0_9ACTN|nr:low molecular weight phosphotyrosine protein phosphatase [Nocardiopsaceae bacterium YIM 96095]
MSLPEPRDPAGPYRISVVCLGNICRSPMAEKVLTAELDRAGLTGTVEVTSSGTGGWHIGSGMDERAAALLRAQGYATDHTARRVEPTHLAEHDLILAMDRDNLENLRRLARGHTDLGDRLRLFRAFASDTGPEPEVPDPYYGGEHGFATVLDMVRAAAVGLTTELAARYDSGQDEEYRGGRTHSR